MIDQTRILEPEEIAAVVGYCHRAIRRNPSRLEVHRNLIVFRLATGAGLRAGEIGGLEWRDMHLGVKRPYIDIRGTISKRGRSRRVPIWDDATLRDLRAWEQRHAGQARTARVVFRTRGEALGRPMLRQEVCRAYRQACRCLPADRRKAIHTHTGRHTFATYGVAHMPLPNVRAALGHASIATTSQYLHVLDADGPGRLFHRPNSGTPDIPDSPGPKRRAKPAAPWLDTMDGRIAPPPALEARRLAQTPPAQVDRPRSRRTAPAHQKRS